MNPQQQVFPFFRRRPRRHIACGTEFTSVFVQSAEQTRSVHYYLRRFARGVVGRSDFRAVRRATSNGQPPSSLRTFAGGSSHGVARLCTAPAVSDHRLTLRTVCRVVHFEPWT
jgi:hypothetical protein